MQVYVHNQQLIKNQIKKKNRMSTRIEKITEICPTSGDRIDKYLWKIKNFYATYKYNEEVLIEESWNLLFQCGAYANVTSFKLVYSKKDCILPSPIIKIAIINKNPQKSIELIEEKSFFKRTDEQLFYSFKNEIDFLKIVKSNPSSWLTNDDVLTVSISIRTLGINHPFIFGLLTYLENEKFTDIIIEVDGKELRAHKLILSIKSPVFSAMFDHESMNESRDNRVVIKDIDADVVKQMLEYIYTGKAPSKLDECVYDLIGAANKYQIDHLKRICEINLMKKLAVDNAVDTLIVADRYDSKELKNKVVELIKQNVSILDSADFKDLELKNANLAIEVLRELIPRK